MSSSGGDVMVSCGFSTGDEVLNFLHQADVDLGLEAIFFSSWWQVARCHMGAGADWGLETYAQTCWAPMRVLLILGPSLSFPPSSPQVGSSPLVLAFGHADCVLGESDLVLSFEQPC